jgi:methionyl-tRNA synthetase
LSFVKRGLQDLSISRLKTSVFWGVPVPADEDHVMYVWLDALSNYITALGYGNQHQDAAALKSTGPRCTWLEKDILRFHTVYWMSFLKAADLPLPKGVYAHGMWLDANGRKMGKTLGNVIEVDVLHEYFQVDAIRYFVLREMVFGQDGKFGYENLIDRTNSDLASGLGNLASRTFSMITKYRDGKVPVGRSLRKIIFMLVERELIRTARTSFPSSNMPGTNSFGISTISNSARPSKRFGRLSRGSTR